MQTYAASLHHTALVISIRQVHVYLCLTSLVQKYTTYYYYYY